MLGTGCLRESCGEFLEMRRRFSLPGSLENVLSQLLLPGHSWCVFNRYEEIMIISTHSTIFLPCNCGFGSWSQNEGWAMEHASMGATGTVFPGPLHWALLTAPINPFITWLSMQARLAPASLCLTLVCVNRSPDRMIIWLLRGSL